MMGAAGSHAREVALSRRTNLALTVVLLALAVAAPFVFYPVFLMKALCFALFACAFNLLIGYVGLLSFGHAAFFGTAAYITAHVVKVWGLEPLSGILLGTAVAAALGSALRWLPIRRQGIYFAMVTPALAHIGDFVALPANFTGRVNGILGVPPGHVLSITES